MSQEGAIFLTRIAGTEMAEVHVKQRASTLPE